MTPMEQRTRALAKANATRSRQAQVRQWLSSADSRREAFDRLTVLIAHDPAVSDLRVFRLLTGCYHVAEPTARRVLRRIGATDSRAVGDLTDRQRERLLEILQ